jgi:superkiller protein 3
MADRYTYVPLVGAALAAVWLIDDGVAGKTVLRWAAVAAGVALAVALAGLSWRQQGIYRDSVAFWEYTIKTNDGSYLAHAQLGQAYNVAKRIREANEHLRRATELNPDCSQAQFNLAYNLMQEGAYDEALRRFGEAVRVSPQFVPAISNIGLCLARQGKNYQAMAKFREALAIDPGYKEARLRLAELLLEADRLGDAAAEFRLVLQYDPKSVLARLNLGAALLKQGRLDDAVAELRRLLEQAPDVYQAHYNLGIALERQGQAAEAERHFAEAERLKRLGSAGR